MGCCWLRPPMGMGSLQGPGRWRAAVLLCWGWRAGTGTGLGRGKQGNLTPEPHCNPGGTRTVSPLSGEPPEKPSLQAAAVFDWLRSRDVQSAPPGSVSPVLLPGVQLLCLRSGNSCCENSSALGKGCVQKAWPRASISSPGLHWVILLGWEHLAMGHADPHGWASLPDLAAASSPRTCLVDVWTWLSSLPSLHMDSTVTGFWSAVSAKEHSVCKVIQNL